MKLNDSESEEEELKEQQIFVAREDGAGEDVGTGALQSQTLIFKRKKYLTQFISQSGFLRVKVLDILKVFTICVVIALIGLCITNHVIMNNELNESETRFEVIRVSYKYAAPPGYAFSAHPPSIMHVRGAQHTCSEDSPRLL